MSDDENSNWTVDLTDCYINHGYWWDEMSLWGAIDITLTGYRVSMEIILGVYAILVGQVTTMLWLA